MPVPSDVLNETPPSSRPSVEGHPSLVPVETSRSPSPSDKGSKTTKRPPVRATELELSHGVNRGVPPVQPIPCGPAQSSFVSAPLEAKTLKGLELPRPEHLKPEDQPPYQKPRIISSFSYGPRRELLLGDKRDASLKEMRPDVRIPFDLNTGLGTCTWRDESVDEGLDALLACLIDTAASNPEIAEGMQGRLSVTRVITWRGILTKIFSAVYETSPNDGWQLNAMVLDGILYLEEHLDVEARRSKGHLQDHQRAQTYHGYSFESLCTSTEAFENVDTNVQWCAVVKATLGNCRMILGGEVDCVMPNRLKNSRSIDTEDFVELKAKFVLAGERDKRKFERYSLLRIYLQSFILGTPLIRVGFRTRDGLLSGWNDFQTLEIPKLGKISGGNSSWSASACVSCADRILSFLLEALEPSSQPSLQASEEAFRTAAAGQTPFDSKIWRAWPVFRVRLLPGSSNTSSKIEVRELDSEMELVAGVLACKPPGPRVGFLPANWVESRFEALRRSTVKTPGPARADNDASVP